MDLNFRYLAREAVKRAKAELATNDPERVKYAALELRFAMEAVTYDRALAFKADIPPEEYNTWQPRKLMQVLHNIDPKIGMTSTIAIGLQDDPGTPAPRERMQTLGTDKVFTLDDLKTHYDAIGSYLHMPSLGQIEKDAAPDPSKLRDRCQVVIGSLDTVLASTVFNSNIGYFSTLPECMRCKSPVRKRIPHGKTKIEATCFECKADYVITEEADGKILWEPKIQEVACQTPGCGEIFQLWPDQIVAGANWKCSACNQPWALRLHITKGSPQ